VNYLVENHPEQAQARLQLGTSALIARPLYLAISRSRPDAQAIIDRFNGQLRGMIADRTYHRLLHVEWIRADVDGDGTAELIPQSDRVGTSEPQRAYAVLSSSTGSGLKIPGSTTTPVTTTEKPGFYIGGNIYRDWASVPENFRVPDPDWKDPRRASASIFRFVF
jgi:polar amino acid transport system substrate-binding protein